MRLSEWRAAAPSRESMSAKVLAVVEPVLSALGTGRDPHCWVVWGDDPAARYLVLAPADAGLATCHVRVNVPQEGPRAAGKLIRWGRVQATDLAIETQGRHLILSLTVEQHVLKAVDAEADRVAAFARVLFAAIDGRPVTFEEATPARQATAGGTRTGPKAAATKTAGAKVPSAATRTAAPKPRAT